MPRQNSSSWSTADNISATRLNDFNEDIDDLYGTGSDRIKAWVTTGLNIQIGAGNYRVASTEGVYAGGIVAMTNNATNYVMIDSAGTIQVSTSAWDINYAKIAIVVTSGGAITSVTNRRNDLIGGDLGGSVQIQSYFMQNIVPSLTSLATALLNSTNTIYIRSFILPAKIAITKITFNVSVFTSSGTMNFAIFSEDGLTRHINFTTATISGTGKVTHTISAVNLPAGQYYVAFQLASGGSFRVDTFNDTTAFLNAVFIPTGGNSLGGTKIAASSGVMDTTINPTTLTLAEDTLLVCRLN